VKDAVYELAMAVNRLADAIGKASQEKEASPLTTPYREKEDSSRVVLSSRHLPLRACAYEGFNPPTLDEIERYAKARKLNFDTAAFFDYYEANGWFTGAVPVLDWKALCRNWHRRQKRWADEERRQAEREERIDAKIAKREAARTAHIDAKMDEREARRGNKFAAQEAEEARQAKREAARLAELVAKPESWMLCRERCANCRDGAGCACGVKVPPGHDNPPRPPEECPHFSAKEGGAR